VFQGISHEDKEGMPGISAQEGTSLQDNEGEGKEGNHHISSCYLHWCQ
jgi:hypothetical protein